MFLPQQNHVSQLYNTHISNILIYSAVEGI